MASVPPAVWSRVGDPPRGVRPTVTKAVNPDATAPAVAPHSAKSCLRRGYRLPIPKVPSPPLIVRRLKTTPRCRQHNSLIAQTYHPLNSRCQDNPRFHQRVRYRLTEITLKHAQMGLRHKRRGKWRSQKHTVRSIRVTWVVIQFEMPHWSCGTEILRYAQNDHIREVVMLSEAKHPVETPQSFSNWITTVT